MPTIKVAKQTSNEIAQLSQRMGNPIYSSFYTTSQNYHRGYDFNARNNSESKTRWDCSELASAIMLQQIKDMRNIDNVKWNTDFSKLQNAFRMGTTTSFQRPSLDAMGVTPITGKRNVMEAELKPGMMIYLQYPRTAGGYSGHVATVTRNPENGELMIAESIGGRNNIGVIHRSVNDFFTKGRIVNSADTKFSLYDPFYKDRATLDKFDQEASRIREHYADAVKAYNQGGIINVRGVSGRKSMQDNKMEFLENFIESRIERERNNSTLIRMTENKETRQLSMLPSGKLEFFNRLNTIAFMQGLRNRNQELENQEIEQQRNSIGLRSI